MPETFELVVNGKRHVSACAPQTPLLHVLRHELELKGSRFGCGLGLCGACFVLMDGRPTPSCDTPLWSAAGREIVTIEGLRDGEALHPAQRAFLRDQAAQCGYCVSGILISAAALLADNPRPDEAAVVAALDRHLCRCGAQRRMIRALTQPVKGGAS
jgi:nicotinate dehydrogenase subunit A